MKYEALAYWYFRLNGFLTTVNFVLHPRRGGSQRTDADILGIRFPYRAEFPEGTESDEPEFAGTLLPFFVIAEITRGECKLNGPWTDPDRGNIGAVLSAIGVYPPETVSAIAQLLYRDGRGEQSGTIGSLFCVGNAQNSTLRSRYPAVPQKTWGEITAFIWRRFRAHRTTKTDVEQWDSTGQQLSELSIRSLSDFERAVRESCGLPRA